MLSAGETSMNINIIGYDERDIKTKEKGTFHIAEIYFTRSRKENEEKKQYGQKAESFTYFFGEKEDAENCDISELLESIRNGNTCNCDVKGRWNNYKFCPSEIEIIEEL